MIPPLTAPAGPPGPSLHRAFRAMLLGAVGIVACDIPTELPIVESRWIVPAEETRFGVAELLPGDVSIAPDSSAFVVDFDSASFFTTLDSLCTACVPFDGLTVPKPPFAASFDSQVDFPPDVYAVTVLDGRVVMEVANGFNFDPLRPSATATGSLTFQVTDDADGDVLASLMIDGADTSFDPGTTLTRSLSLAPTTVDGSLVASVLVDSPLGDDVTIDVADTLGVVARPAEVRVAGVTVDVAGRVVSFDAVELDVDDVDVELQERIVEGTFVLEVTNPFAIASEFELSITGPTIAPIVRTATIGSAAISTVRIDFTGDELRSFLGEPGVVLSGEAVVDAGSGLVTILPGQELVLDAELDLTILLGPEDDS